MNELNTNYKICSQCKENKSIETFYKNKQCKDGLHSKCKLCLKTNHQKYYINNREDIREKSKEWKLNNPEKFKQSNINWHNKNKEKMEVYIKEYGKQYYQNNKEKVAQYIKNYYQQNKEKLKQKAAEYNKKPEVIIRKRESKRKSDRKKMENPFHRISNNMRGNMYHALKAKKGFRKWEDLVGYTLQDLINHMTPLLIDGMTWDNYGSEWHVDHIKPKSWFNYQSTDEPQFKECWSLFNLQPKWKHDNLSKGNRFIG